MKLLAKYLIIISLNIFWVNVTIAQNEISNVSNKNKFEIEIPSLKVIIDSVIKNNALLRYRKKGVEVRKMNLKSERIYWTRNFGVQLDSRYGNLNSFSTNEDDLGTLALANNTKQFSYNFGVYVKFPVFEMLNVKHETRKAKMEIEEAEIMAQHQEDEARKIAIQLYGDLILKQKLLRIKAKKLSDVRVNMQMIEEEFRNGAVPVTEYVRISSIGSNVESEYESAKSNFLVSKKLLEDVAGFTFGITISN